MKLENFMEEQLRERYKHFIIYGPPMQGKTKLAMRVSELFGGIYIDLLDEFQRDNGKKEMIDVFGPDKLIAYVKERRHTSLNNRNSSEGEECPQSELKNTHAKLLVVDQMDFLINTWDDNQFRELLAYADQNQSEFCCMFVIHNYRILERETLIKDNDKGHNRLINIYSIQQGGTING